MISRRQLIGGLSLLPLGAGIASCSARAGVSSTTSGSTSSTGTTAPSGTIPYVAPGPNWNGAPKSGGVPSVFTGGNVSADPIRRTTAKPAIHWLVPSGQVLAPGADLVIGVDADAGGAGMGTGGTGPSGVKQVDFWVEGTAQTITTPSFYTDTDANGNPRTRWGYWIKLRQSDFTAHLNGEVRIFATAVPNDTTMQSRVIGYDLFNSGLDDGNYPLSVLPRSSLHDFSYNVAPSNNDVSPNFTTLKKALSQAAADNAERPIITFTASGNYEAENLANHVSGSKAFCTITTSSSSVVANIGRATAFTPNNPSSWTWTPGWDGIEFRGSGIVFQQRNWTTMILGRASWFNGCKFTNSIGARDTNYWNGQGHPGCGAGGLMCWMDDVYAEYVSRMYLNNYYAIGCKAKQTSGSIFTGCHYVYNTYVRDYTNNYFRQPNVNRISITYTNPGGHSSAMISRPSGANLTTGQSLTFTLDGVARTIPLGFYSTDTNPTVQDVVNAINALGVPGLSASVLNSGGVWPAASIGFNGGDWSFSKNVFNTTVSMNATPDPHGEWWQGYGPSSTAQSPPARENVIVRNNILRDSPTDPWMNMDDASNGDQSQDHIVKGNIVTGVGASNGTSFGGAASGANSMSHMIFERNTVESEILRNDGASTSQDRTYSSYRNNVCGVVLTNSSSNFQYTPPWSNNVFKRITSGGMNVFGGTGNISWNDIPLANFSDMFTSYSTGDLRPKSGTVLLTNLVAVATTFLADTTAITVYDRNGTAYASSDCMGALSKNSPAPPAPF